MLVLASGQLPVASTVILTQGQAVVAGAPQPQAWGQPISVSLYNSSGSTETILLKLLRNGGSTATVVGRFVLATLESAAVSCLVLGPGDALYGQTTDATSVDYTVFEANPGSFQAVSYDANGQIKQTNGTSITGATTITSTSANAFDVGPAGATNPTLQIDASTSSAATGIKVKSAAAASGVAIQAITSGTNEDMTIDAAASGTVKIGTVAATALGLQVGSSTSAANAKLIVQTTSATGFVVGRLGATTPAFQVDANTATSITGVKIKSAATTAGVAISAIGEASNGNISFDAQGSGIVEVGGTSTGQIFVGKGGLKALVTSSGIAALGTTQSSTPTSAQLLGGLVTQISATGAGAVTLPTGTALSAACGRTPVTGDTFECRFMHISGGQTLTITGATGTTVSGTATVASGTMSRLLFYCVSANVWNIYCAASA